MSNDDIKDKMEEMRKLNVSNALAELSAELKAESEGESKIYKQIVITQEDLEDYEKEMKKSQVV